MKNLLLLLLPLLIITCKKDKAETYPFENETVLDCRNLKVRKVEFVRDTRIMNPSLPVIEITIENTCKSCEDNWVYLGLFMVNKNTGDTVAWTCSTCLGVVKNKTRGIYELETSLNALPDLTGYIFDYSYICRDVPYEPR